MLKLFVTTVVLLHGLIHAIGFVKAFGLAEIDEATKPISRPWGVVWGACVLLFVAAAAARIANADWWWMLGAPALLVSQVVVTAFWTDAKLGTIVNVALIVPVAIAFGSWRFAAQIDADVARLAERPVPAVATAVSPGDTAALPPVVAAWLDRAGVVGRSRTHSVQLTQRGELQAEPDAAWMPFRAEQWVRVHEPAFVWAARVNGRFGMDLAGRDRYLDGKGSMRIELLSLVPVVDATGPTIDQGALVRFLAEMMWYPSAALSSYVEWAPIDDHSARATMRYGDVEAAGTFRFDANGDVVGFEARRYRDDELEDSIIENDPAAFGEHDGVRIPTRSTITWRNEEGKTWTWLRLEVVSLARNAPLT